MTAGLAETDCRAPVLVLGLGNLLLQDDAVGLHLLESVSANQDLPREIEFVEGGTQGLALLGYLGQRRLVVILDAVGLGAAPGTVHLLREPAIEHLRAHKSTTAHEGNALELLAISRLLGDAPEQLVIIGVEPQHVRTGVGLSDTVAMAIPQAASLVAQVVEEFVSTGVANR